jgi:type IV fimbrial biogenesis protein FimT
MVMLINSKHLRAAPRMPLDIEGGFTLVELMIGVSIVAILTMIALPSVASLLRNIRASSETNAIMSAVRLVRTEAIKRGTTVSIAPLAGQTNLNKGWVVFVDRGNTQDPTTKGNDLIAERSDVPDNMSIDFSAHLCGATGTASGDTSKLSLNRFSQCGNGAAPAFSIIVAAKEALPSTAIDTNTRRIVCMTSSGRFVAFKRDATATTLCS